MVGWSVFWDAIRPLSSEEYVRFGSFFDLREAVFPGLSADQSHELFDERLKLLVGTQVCLHLRHMSGRDVFGPVEPVLPAMEVAAGTVGCLPDDLEGASFHLFDGSEPTQDVSRCIHRKKIYARISSGHKKEAITPIA